jgi:mono/diheme cytochrome c family protein
MRSQHKYPNIQLIIFLVPFLILFVVGSVFAQSEDADELEIGARVYTENCAVCHGLNGEGRIGATLAQNWPSIRPDLATMATITEGIPGSVMPPWDEGYGGPLTAAEIDAVVMYILSWQTGGAPVIQPELTVTTRPAISPIPEVQGDPNKGAQLYDYNCKVCHGTDGQGRIGPNLSDTWGSIRPDLAIRSTLAQGLPGSAMPAWSKEYGGPLTDGEINDLVAFVSSLPGQAEPVVTSTPPSPLESLWVGWGGVILTLFLFALIVISILLIQKRR